MQVSAGSRGALVTGTNGVFDSEGACLGGVAKPPVLLRSGPAAAAEAARGRGNFVEAGLPIFGRPSDCPRQST